MLTGNSINGAGDWEKTQVELFSESEQQKVTFSQKHREDQGLLIVKKEFIMKFRKGNCNPAPYQPKFLRQLGIKVPNSE